MTDEVIPGYPEEGELRKRVLELMGSFAALQDFLMTAVDFYFRKESPDVGKWVQDRYAERVNDAERIRWFHAVVLDSPVEGLPIDAMIQVFNEAKSIRDMLAHSRGVTPMWSNERWVVRISHANSPKVRERVEALPELTIQEFNRQMARLSWFSGWLTWFPGEGKYSRVDDMWGNKIEPPKPDSKPPA